MARFYIIGEDYSVKRTDDPETAKAAAETEIVIDTQTEEEIQPYEDSTPIPEYTA